MTGKQKKALIRIGIAAVCFVGGLLIPYRPVSLGLLAAAYLCVGLDVLKEAAEGIVHGQVFDENFLMTIAY